MVRGGIAAVELSTLLLDPVPLADTPPADGWRADPEPAPTELLARGLADRAREQLELLQAPLELAASPRRLLELPSRILRTLWAVGDAVVPAPAATPFNEPSSPLRHLATLRRSGSSR